jgi:hypothetical protein
MKGIVLIPAWQRAEFLWHCLANIKRAVDADQYHYIFRFDTGFSPDLLTVVAGFPFSHEITYTARSGYRLSKQSYSLLTGYALAASKTDGLVIMVEEDVMVRDDFFLFHEAVHAEQTGLFCSIGVANPNRKMVSTGPDNAYYLSTGDYCSLGVAFRPKVLRELVLPHAVFDYYLNPVDYCRRNFKGSPFGDAFAEQDGLIRRVEWSPTGEAGAIAWPWKPRAYHAGLYGKNRGAGPAGPFAKRLQYVTDVIYSDQAMQAFARHQEWYEDSRPINLTAPVKHTELVLQTMNPATNPLRV